MADATNQARIRAAIKQWAERYRHPHGTLLSALAVREVDDLVECIDRALQEDDQA